MYVTKEKVKTILKDLLEGNIVLSECVEQNSDLSEEMLSSLLEKLADVDKRLTVDNAITQVIEKFDFSEYDIELSEEEVAAEAMDLSDDKKKKSEKKDKKDDDEDEDEDKDDDDDKMKKLRDMKKMKESDTKDKKEDDDDEDEDDDDDNVEESIKVDTETQIDNVLNKVGLVEGEFSKDFIKTIKKMLNETVVLNTKNLLEKRNARLQEKFEKKVEEKIKFLEEKAEEYVEKALTEYTDKASDWADFVVEKWLEENREVNESNAKTEILESFVEDMKEVFLTHNIEIPEAKVDLFDELSEERSILETKIDELVTENVNLKKQFETLKKDAIIKEHIEELSVIQKEKFLALVENITFDDSNEFRSQLNEIKKNYFEESVVTEEIVEDFNIELDDEKNIVNESAQTIGEKYARFIKNKKL